MKRFGRLIETRGQGLLRAAGLMTIAVALGIGLAHGSTSAARAPTQSTATNSPAYKFEVATIRPSRPSSDGGGGFEADGFRVRNFPLNQSSNWLTEYISKEI